MAKAVLVDITRCMGCRGCQVSCKQWHEQQGLQTVFKGELTNPPELNVETCTTVHFIETMHNKLPVWSFVKEQCYHCHQPVCVVACPVGALEANADGAVTRTAAECAKGCTACVEACPFHIPKRDETARNSDVQKCNFCDERIMAGDQPACIKACPSEALYFDDRDKVTAEAEKRIAAEPDKYVKHIYGLKEAGGTNWLYISHLPFTELGFEEVPEQGLFSAVSTPVPPQAAKLLTMAGAVASFRNRGARESRS